MTMYKFHRKCGDRVTLLNQNLTAIRNFVEFNHGLILSAEPLTDDVLFEVRIDRKVNVWNGSLEIGVTTLDPDVVDLPATATKLRNTAWVLSGNTVVKDGITVLNTNWPELDSLQEGDCIAVSRTNKAELKYFINGRCLGVAAKDIPERLFAVIDLYGQCVQVSIVHSNYLTTVMDLPYESTTSEPEAGTSPPIQHEDTVIDMPVGCYIGPTDKLRFHPRSGILVSISNCNKSAERVRPLDDYNNGVVMTHRPLRDDELFQIRIDKLVDKWSGSIEVGVTSHNPATVRFPSTMTNMDSGTIMMSGCKVLINGQGACLEYGSFNLDELREGDTVGMIRKSNGKLHYFINGVDQGVAADEVPPEVWGVIDLYGMTVKVTVMDAGEDQDSNIDEEAHYLALMPPPPDSPYDDQVIEQDYTYYEPSAEFLALTSEEVLNLFTEAEPEPSTSGGASVPQEPAPSPNGLGEDQLLFHTLRGSHVIIINNGRTAHRPNAFEVFNNGFVMTNRTLKTNELFQVRLDLVIPKWAGSIEIGITQYSSNEIPLPFRMTNSRSGTWCMAGEDVIRGDTVIIPQYVRNLSRLLEGDTVGVMRKEMGILHFYVNGVDQGPAAFNIPEQVFGIIDLYGRVAQATIVQNFMHLPASSPESPMSICSIATVLPEMCFHRVHGHNARLSRNRLIASRATVYSEFNDAVLFSSRPLRECDMFEIRIDKMVDCWIGSLEIGVTAIRPDDLEANGGLGALAGTATDLSWDTYILSGSAMMKDGECIRSGYPLDLDSLTVGSKVGMMWHADRSLHYYLDGMDMGKAWYVPHLNIYAVVDLYGQCTQVAIMQNEERAFNYNGCNADHGIANTRAWCTATPPYWSFSEYHGDNVTLSRNYTLAARISPDPMGGLVFSSTHLIVNEIYEIQIVECKHPFAGTFRIGITDINVLNANVNRNLPVCPTYLPHFTAYIDGQYIKYSRPGPTREQELQSFVPSFEWLRPGDRIGLKKTEDSRVLVYFNSELLDSAFEKTPDKVYVLMEMYGRSTKIQMVSRGISTVPVKQQTIPNDKPETNGTSAAVLTLPKIPDDIAPVMLGSDETSEMADGQCEAPSTPAETDPLDDIIQTDRDTTDSPREEKFCDLPKTPVTTPDDDNSSPEMSEMRQSRAARPYTFHFLTGKNIRLCSSDTVALRYNGYCDGVAVASQPLHRGTSFRIRVDKTSEDWEGTVAIGALATLPTEMPPSTALHFNVPCWVVTNDILYNRGIYTISEIGRKLDEVTENSVLTLHFRNNSDLALEIDGAYSEVIATIPSCYNDIYPLIDLYGKVVQVSILLHPHVIIGGTSLDLPIVEEKIEESPDEDLHDVSSDSDSDADEEDSCEDSYSCHYTLGNLVINDDYSTSSDEEPDGEIIYNFYNRTVSECETHSDDDDQSEESGDGSNAIDNSSDPVDDSNPLAKAQEMVHEQYEPTPGPSSAPDDPQTVLYTKDAMNFEIKARSWPPKSSLHQSLLLEDAIIVIDNDLAAETRGLKKSQSTLLFPQNAPVTEEPSDNPVSEDSSSGDSMINPLGLGSHILDDDSDSLDEIEETCDTNIRHNDRYPEANVNELYDSCHDNDGFDASDANDDNFDNVFMDAMFLETSNMPDLDEEQSLSFDDSTTTRPDDYWSDGLSIENLHYLNGIFGLDEREKAARLDRPDWAFYSETNGNCEVMHVALKFWNQIVAPYSDMRDVVTRGNIHCFCLNCDPDESAHSDKYTGWVRIERAKPEEEPSKTPLRMLWHVVRATITSAQALNDANAEMRRPRYFRGTPSTVPSLADTWIDEEGKPHQAALALDIDINNDEPQADRLLAYWIYIRSHASILLEAEDIEDTVGDAVDDIEQDADEDIVEDAVDDIDTLLDDDEETIGEAAETLINEMVDLNGVLTETDPQNGDTEE